MLTMNINRFKRMSIAQNYYKSITVVRFCKIVSELALLYEILKQAGKQSLVTSFHIPEFHSS